MLVFFYIISMFPNLTVHLVAVASVKSKQVQTMWKVNCIIWCAAGLRAALFLVLAQCIVEIDIWKLFVRYDYSQKSKQLTQKLKVTSFPCRLAKYVKLFRLKTECWPVQFTAGCSDRWTLDHNQSGALQPSLSLHSHLQHGKIGHRALFSP